MKINDETIERIRDNWLLASKELNFEIITPFKFDYKNKEEKAFAFLPQYGSFNGIIIGLTCAPKFETDNIIVEWAKIKGCYYSFINMENYINYNRNYFIEALEDWGNYGIRKN